MPFADLDEVGHLLAEELGIREGVSVEPYFYTSAKCNCRFRNGRYIIRISKFFEDAPGEVIFSIVGFVLAKASGNVPARYSAVYRNYLRSDESRKKLERYRSVHVRKILRGETGRYHDLGESFDRVNNRYFHGRLHGITLTWGRASRRTLGHYDSAKRTVVVSSILDKSGVPEYLVDYLVFHELLHHVHPTFYRNGRRVVHSKEFREHEKEFSRYSDAKQKMKKLR